MIRRADEGDRAGLEELYDVCFPGERSFREWIFSRVWKPANALVCELDGQSVAGLMDIPVRLSLGGRHFDAHYIYAAGTLPRWRGQGIMGGLLQRAFADGARCGQQFSVLITQSESLFEFYRPFGYTTLSALSRWTAAPAQLPDGYILRAASKEDFPQMLDIYETETRAALAIYRDEQYFGLMLELYGSSLVVLQDDARAVKAYAFTEKSSGTPLVSEIFGERSDVLAAALCNQMGSDVVFQGVAGAALTQPNGCIKALNENAGAVLAGMSCPPYINIMFN